MSELITTLHPQDDNSVNLYPNVKLENIVDGTAEDAGKFVKVNEEGKFIVETVNIPEPQQVNNSTVTIKQGGVDKGSFTLNQAEDATIELDAGGGSNMYATSSAISKGAPAYKEAANPIKVGDTISQLYFNTQQDIKPYLETCVDWGNGKKVIATGGISLYPLFTTISDANEAGFRELKVGDYIYGLKIKADYTPGDGKVDPELDSWLATILNSTTSINLFSVGDFSNPSIGLRAGKNETGSGTEYTLTSYMRDNSNYPTVIYSSKEGFRDTTNWDSSEHVYKLVSGNSDKETVITEISETESAGWNGVFFGAASNLGGIALSALKWSGSFDSYSLEDVYMILPNPFATEEAFNNVYYSSSPFPGPGGVIKGGWHVTADQAVALSKPERVTTVSDVVSKIASSEANWMSVPEVFGSIYQDDILGTDEVKINDILVDTTGTLGKVKEFSEELVKNQHPANPFAVGDEIPANSYVYIDTSITPDLSKLDWSGFDPSGSDALFPLAPLSSFILTQFTPFMALGGLGIKLNKPIYALMIGDGTCSYFQVDPSDVDKVLSSSLFQYSTGGVNKWTFASDVVTHEGSIFKVPLENAETVTLTGINDQDVWGAFISKDGRWVEDTPISRTKVSCEALRQLPTNYDNLDGIPILKLDYVLTEAEGYEFIPENYINKYIQDPTGIIYFCDGQHLYELTGSSGGFSGSSININTTNGIHTLSTSSSSTDYNTTIGLETTNLGQYSQASGDQVFGKRSGSYGWMNLPSQSGTSIQAGSGIEVSGNTVSLTSRYVNSVINSENGMYVMAHGGSSMSDQIGWCPVSIPRGVTAGTGLTSTAHGSTTDTISLSQDTQDRLMPSTSSLDPIYKYHLVRSNSSNNHEIVWEKTQSTSIGTGLVQEITTPSEQTVKIGLSPSNLNYTQPNTKVYAKNTDSNTFGWVSLPEPSPARTVVAGTGILVAEYGSTSDIVSLSQEVQNKLARIPDLPTGDGNYALTCTISGGVATFAWTPAS